MDINAINKDVRLIGTVLKLFSSAGNEKTLRMTASSSAKVMEKWGVSSLRGKSRRPSRTGKTDS